MAKKLNSCLTESMCSLKVYISLSDDEKSLKILSCEDNKAMRPATLVKLKDIKSFIFGGTSSRFWMVRKLINQMGKKFDTLPFYAW